MAETKCDIHGHRLTEIESRLSNIEADLDSIISENRNTADSQSDSPFLDS